MGLEFQARQTWLGQEITNKFVYDGVDAIPSNADAIAVYIADRFVTVLGGGRSNTISLDSIEYREFPPSPGQPFVPANVPGLPISGGNITATTPTQTACRVYNRSAVGPSYKSGLYLCGFTNSSITLTGLWSQGLLDDVAEFMGDIQTAGAALTLNIVYGFYSSGTATVPQYTFSPITNISVQANPSTQRRRKLGVGS